ncbi:MAG: hypothetical protein MPW15_19600 [Candidatus Manganitrophus sp.]|nr:hypothetical protein [Candidatus Manganitrophus sp.]
MLATATASEVIRVAFTTFWEISFNVAVISSAAVATVCTLRLVCSLAEETVLANFSVCSEFAPICWPEADISSDAADTSAAFSRIWRIISRRFCVIVLNVWAKRPISSNRPTSL